MQVIVFNDAVNKMMATLDTLLFAYMNTRYRMVRLWKVMALDQNVRLPGLIWAQLFKASFVNKLIYGKMLTVLVSTISKS